jgi:hypothetical protein
MSNSKFCTRCGTAIVVGSHFCANCGQTLDAVPANTPASGGASLSLMTVAPWFVLASIVLIALGYFIGRRGAEPTRSAAGPVQVEDQGAIVIAPDISTLSPEERVDRLFNRVMALAAAGKMDSVQFFAPMAINALAALMPLDAHRRYDLGLIQLTAGDAPSARAQSDTILKEQPSHLLGLSLAMRVARAQNRTADATRLGAQLIAAAPSERAKRLPEYTDHAPDLTDALNEAKRP